MVMNGLRSKHQPVENIVEQVVVSPGESDIVCSASIAELDTCFWPGTHQVGRRRVLIRRVRRCNTAGAWQGYDPLWKQDIMPSDQT